MTGFEHDPYQPQRPAADDPQPWGGRPNPGPAFGPGHASQGHAIPGAQPGAHTGGVPPYPPIASITPGPGPFGDPATPSAVLPPPPHRSRRKRRTGIALVVAGTIAA